MNSKEKAIELAYVKLIGQEKYDEIKEFVDDNGLCSETFVDWHKLFKSSDLEFEKDYLSEIVFRPISLQGIENNNSWIKIESEKDLPSEYDTENFKLMYFTNNGIYEANDYKKWKLHIEHLEITHYQLLPKTILQPPIY